MCAAQVHAVNASLYGTSVGAILLSKSAHDGNTGCAVSYDGQLLAVAHTTCIVTVYSLPLQGFRCSFGGSGSVSVEIAHPGKLCFTALSNLLIVEQRGNRIHEVTASGDHVRYIGTREVVCDVWAVATNDVLIALGAHNALLPVRVLLFDAATGSYVRRCNDSSVSGAVWCWGIRFTLDNAHIAAVTSDQRQGAKLVVFDTATGVVTQSERYAGMAATAPLVQDASDIEFVDDGGLALCDRARGTILHKHAGRRGGCVDQFEFENPVAMAWCAGQLIVLPITGPRVLLFQ